MNKSPWHHRKVDISYPDYGTISGDRLYIMFQDAIVNGELDQMPEDWEHALMIAEDYLDITIIGKVSRDWQPDRLYRAQYDYACGYHD